MRFSVIALAIVASLALPSAAVAADPLVGAWTLDVSRSTYPASARPPKALTEIYTQTESGMIEMTAHRVSASGATSSGTIRWPAEGGLVQDPQGTQPAGRVIVQTLQRPGEWLTVFLTDGKQSRLLRKQISADGKEMIQTQTALDAQGHLIEEIQIFHRQ